MNEVVNFTFDGRQIRVRAGISLAAALTEAGIRKFRVDPRGEPRGVFCGMGVCQDCLVEVDHIPNQRACMTKVEEGLAVCTQAALPRLEEGPERVTDAVVEAPDVLIVGGGAGGLSAAVEAARAGASVLLLDERNVAGGQYFKQRTDGRPLLDRQQRAGHVLCETASRSGVRVLNATEVWGAVEGPVIYATHRNHAVIVRPRAMIIATGAYERPRFVPGWDLPGVMTTGAAQTLWRSYGTLPGSRVAVLGNGPLNLQVADELRAGGAEIVVVAEAASAPWAKILVALQMLAASPDLTVNGLLTTLRLLYRGIPVRYGTVVAGIRPEGNGLLFDLRDSGGRSSCWAADAVCMNYGFHPQNEILRLLGAVFDYDASRAQLVCRRASDCETTVAGVYAVGDCCGLGGAPSAMEEGRIAGRAAAARVLRTEVAPTREGWRHLARHRRFQRALWTLFAAEVQGFAEIQPETLICRCEGVRRADIDRPGSEPETGIGGVKRATRAGMGRCQGRYCGPILAPWMAGSLGRRMNEREYFAPRVPVKPVPISAVLAAREAVRDTG